MRPWPVLQHCREGAGRRPCADGEAGDFKGAWVVAQGDLGWGVGGILWIALNLGCNERSALGGDACLPFARRREKQSGPRGVRWRWACDMRYHRATRHEPHAPQASCAEAGLFMGPTTREVISQEKKRGGRAWSIISPPPCHGGIVSSTE
eukprot:scaffold30579_cov129-Isochrysis_galbana.AAC.2